MLGYNIIVLARGLAASDALGIPGAVAIHLHDNTVHATRDSFNYSACMEKIDCQRNRDCISTIQNLYASIMVCCGCEKMYSFLTSRKSAGTGVALATVCYIRCCTSPDMHVLQYKLAPPPENPKSAPDVNVRPIIFGSFNQCNDI